MVERLPNITKTELITLIKRGIDYLIDERLPYDNYVFIGKKSGIKIPVDYGLDIADNTKKLLVIPTVLSINQMYNFRDEIEILVELILNATSRNEIAEIIDSITKNGLEKTVENFTKNKTIIINSRYDDGKGLPFQYIIEEGKIDKTWDVIKIKET